MTQNLSPEEMIRANAEMVLAFAREETGQDLRFDEGGVRWLDGYIQALVEQGGVEASEQLCDNLGSFLGTSIIGTYGGTWQDTEYGWAVVIKDDFAVFPFNKALKHLTEGAGESVFGLFSSIPALLEHAAEAHEAAGIAGPTPSEPIPATDGRSGSVISRLGGFFRRR